MVSRQSLGPKKQKALSTFGVLNLKEKKGEKKGELLG